MSDSASPPLRRCWNCGTYYTPEKSTGPLCSPACGEKYERCGICGKYFLSGEGIGGGICSQECSKVYTQPSNEAAKFVSTKETA